MARKVRDPYLGLCDECGCDHSPIDVICNDLKLCIKGCRAVYVDLCRIFVCTPFKCQFKQICVKRCNSLFSVTKDSDCRDPPCHTLFSTCESPACSKPGEHAEPQQIGQFAQPSYGCVPPSCPIIIHNYVTSNNINNNNNGDYNANNNNNDGNITNNNNNLNDKNNKESDIISNNDTSDKTMSDTPEDSSCDTSDDRNSDSLKNSYSDTSENTIVT